MGCQRHARERDWKHHSIHQVASLTKDSEQRLCSLYENQALGVKETEQGGGEMEGP